MAYTSPRKHLRRIDLDVDELVLGRIDYPLRQTSFRLNVHSAWWVDKIMSILARADLVNYEYPMLEIYIFFFRITIILIYTNYDTYIEKLEAI